MAFVKRLLIAFLILLTFAEARHWAVRVPNRCITNISKTDHTACEGSDINHLKCTGIKLDYACTEFPR